MLVRLVVIALCTALVASELQCPGSGRFSTSPGICTAEYYTCNRDVNKEYTAYVLSCPGKTLFNERTRKCSSARTVLSACAISTPSGQIRVTTLRREKITTQQSFPWISRPSHGYTLKQRLDNTKPGTLPWGTPRPHLYTTLAMKTQVKPQKNQWRIRKSTTKKTMPTTSLKPLPAKVMIRRTTHSPHRQKVKTTSKKMAGSVYLNKTSYSVHLSKSPANPEITETVTSSTTSALHSLDHPTPLQDKNVNIMSSLVPDTISASAVTPSIQAITSRDTNTTLTPTTASPTSTTVKIKPIVDKTLCSCDQHKTQITSGYVNHPLIVSTSPQTFNADNIYDTTPEVTIKNNQIQIPFMDSLESSEQRSDMEIVQVDFNPSTKKETNQKKIELMKQNINAIKHIRYFYDPVLESPLHASLAGNIENPSRLPMKKNEHKILAKKRRQPK